MSFIPGHRGLLGAAGRSLCLWLALALAISPSLSLAGMSLAMPPADGPAEAAMSMPCHTVTADDPTDTDPAMQDSCPHCGGNAPASQCQCAQAMPAGVAGVFLSPAPRFADRERFLAVSYLIARSPGESRFRPPIILS